MTAPILILAQPQLGENIGAAARAMANFGLSELRIINPRDGWPNETALAMAAHAGDIIRNAVICQSLEEALADIHYVAATTARNRYLAKPVLTPAEMVEQFAVYQSGGHRCAILFGPERTGLTNDEVTLANACISIPVHPDCPSINLAQSVAILCYQLYSQQPGIVIAPEATPASGQEISGLFEHLESELDAKHFFKVPEKREGMVRNIRNIFKRVDHLSSQDIRTLRGIISALTSKG